MLANAMRKGIFKGLMERGPGMLLDGFQEPRGMGSSCQSGLIHYQLGDSTPCAISVKKARIALRAAGCRAA